MYSDGIDFFPSYVTHDLKSVETWIKNIVNLSFQDIDHLVGGIECPFMCSFVAFMVSGKSSKYVPFA